MSKSVLISIKPEWCELIASGEKTIEIRKTKPKLEVKDTIIAELSKMNNLTTDKLWEMNGVLINKATERKCRDVK